MLFTTFPLRLSVTVLLLHMVCCTTITWTSPTTTPPPTTKTTLPPGSCLHAGKLYMNGEVIEKDETYNCYQMKCEYGSTVYYDHMCMFYTPTCFGESYRKEGECCPICNTTTTPTTTPTTTTTTTPTTTPTYACYYNGTGYHEGVEVETDEDHCGGKTCLDGEIVAWASSCPFLTCSGMIQKIPGQCCEQCMVPTTPTTTPTTTPRDGCTWNGNIYMEGDAIQTDPNNCGGLICQNGGILAWDAECAFHTPECNGTLVPIEGQCCPDCRETTTPKTTTPPARTCNVNGTVYQQGEEVKRDPNNCWGQECMDGEIVTWTLDCLPVTCNDPQNIPGKCCQVCPETTTPKTTTPTTLTECYINGSRYFNGQRLNTDPCNVCRCINNNQTCTEIQCEPIDTLDCASDTQIRPYDTCCFTCGSSRMETTFTWLLLIAMFLTRVCHHI